MLLNETKKIIEKQARNEAEERMLKLYCDEHGIGLHDTDECALLLAYAGSDKEEATELFARLDAKEYGYDFCEALCLLGFCMEEVYEHGELLGTVIDLR